MMKRFTWILVSAVMTSLLISSGSLSKEKSRAVDSGFQGSSLGKVNFNATCDDGVVTDFNDAVALMHHMQYEAARTVFEQIIATDSECGMAHWGIAMTLFQPLWPSRPSQETLQKGSEAVQKAQSLGTKSNRDLALLEATAAFYQDLETADWWTRIDRWHAGMKAAYQDYPEDIEVAVFYALSNLAAGQNQDDRLNYNAESAEILRQIYERESRHPGAIHYTIHANDVDARANESLDMVRSYGEIAPDVPHALHMPTHIFVRLGYWPEVIEWNRRSADAALKYPAASGISHHYIHAIDYMVYAYLQQGKYSSARALLSEALERDEKFQGTFLSAFHLATIPARFALERRAWDEAAAITPAADESVSWEKFYWPEAMSWFARGLGAAQEGDLDGADLALARMEALKASAMESGEQAFATYIEIDRLVLASWRAQVGDQPEAAIALAEKAVELESTIQKHPVSPGSLYPAQESMGDLLLTLDQPQQALAAYEASLETWPGRYNSLNGAYQAALLAGMDETAAFYDTMLKDNVSNISDEKTELE